MKNVFNGLSKGLDIVKERNSDLEDMSLEISRAEMESKKWMLKIEYPKPLEQ